MGDTEDGLAAGKKLLISCKIGDYENIMNLLDEIEEMEQADKDAALDAVDKKGNTHLHLILNAPDSIDDFYETPTDDKKDALIRLLDMGADELIENDDGDKPEDVCPDNFKRILKDYFARKRKKAFRGGSIVAEAAVLKSVKSAANSIIAAAKFKGLLSRAGSGSAGRTGSTGSKAAGAGGDGDGDGDVGKHAGGK